MKKLFLALIILLFASPLWGATYYMREDGTAANKAAASGPCGTVGNCMSIATHDADTYSAGDTIILCDDSATSDVYRDQMDIPSSGSAGSPIVYETETGDTPIINGFETIGTWTERLPIEEAAGGLFVSGLEDEVAAFTTDFDGKTEAGSSTVTVGTSIIHGGIKNLTSTFDGSNLNCYAHKTIAAQADVYIRAYIRRNSTFDHGAAISHTNILALRDASTRTVMGLNARDNGGDNTGFFCYIYNNAGAKTNIYVGPTDFAADIWYLVEMRYLVDGAVGGGQVWIDGVSKGSNFTKDTSGQDVDTIRAGGQSEYSFNNQPVAGSKIYIDDIKVDNGAIGAATVYRTNTWGATNNTEPKLVYFDNTLGSVASTLYDLDAAEEWYWLSNVLYAYSTADPDGAYTAIDAATRNYGMRIRDRSYITVDGLEFKGHNYYGLQIDPNGTSISNIIIKNCKSWKNYYDGIRGAGAGANVITDVTIQNNELSYNGGHGLRFGTNCNTWTITQNDVHHNSTLFSATGFFSSTGGIRGNSAPAADCHTITIEENEVYNNGDTLAGDEYCGKGIWLDTTGANQIVRYNKCYDNHNHGIFLEVQDSAAAYYNLCYGNGGYGISLRAGSDSNLIYNNSCYNNLSGIEVNGTITGASNNLIKNNILSGNTSWELSCLNGGENAGGSSGNVYLYNCLGVEAANFIQWGDGVYKSTYDLWETAYGGTTNSAEADPLFKDAASNDYTLKPDSPCCKAGIYISGYTTKPSWVCDDITDCDYWIENYLTIGVYPCPFGAAGM